jgi:16S rRNA G1207 methylase RsmC
VRLDLPDRSLELSTDRGVFSPGRVDPGTKLLLLELPALTRGPVIDVGCGYGPIACTVALRHPELTVVGVDVNPRARALCATNATALGASVEVLDPEGAEALHTIGTIVSNPPIRIGKAALHDLLSGWLDRLAPDGRAYLVVHKNLGADSLADWLRDRGHEVQKLRSRQGYRVLEVSRG